MAKGSKAVVRKGEVVSNQNAELERLLESVAGQDIGELVKSHGGMVAILVMTEPMPKRYDFRWTYNSTIDGQHRLVVPTEFVRQLESNPVLVVGTIGKKNELGILVYDSTVELPQLPYRMNILSKSLEGKIDAQNRMSIGTLSRQIDWLKPGTEVFITGQGSYFIISNKRNDDSLDLSKIGGIVTKATAPGYHQRIQVTNVHKFNQ